VTHHPAEIREVSGVRVTRYDFASQHDVVLPLYLVEPATAARYAPTQIIVRPLGAAGWKQFAAGQFDSTDSDKGTVWAFVAPRGIGPSQWSADGKKQIHIRRRFMLLGQTLDGMRAWDVRRAIQTLRGIDGLADVPITLAADDDMAGIALYAALFEPKIHEVALGNLPATHRDGPDFLNVLRILDIPQTVAMVAEKSHVVLREANDAAWEYPLAVAKNLGWNDQVTIQHSSDEHKAAKSLSRR
jgi:hypothetical protein